MIDNKWRKLKDLIWRNNRNDHAPSPKDLDELKEKYSGIKIYEYQDKAGYRCEIHFDNKAEESYFIMREC